MSTPDPNSHHSHSASATIGSPEKPICVRALHAYKPVNNDELKLEKGDIITITQKEEGGWWEGTLNGRTGWFPANYTTEHDSLATLTIGLQSLEVTTSTTSGSNSPLKTLGGTATMTLSPTPTMMTRKPHLANTHLSTSLLLSAPTEEQLQYRRMVLSELTTSEGNLVDGMQGLWDTHLQNLAKSGILTTVEFRTLTGNYSELIQSHRINILNSVCSEIVKPAKEQRIGKIFLDNAPKLEYVHKIYCENHPKAVQIIEKHKESLTSFLEGALQQPGIIILITGLSWPFSRLEKYPTLLQELERHVEESHKDRGDLQRSIEYYKQIDKTCISIRKQKEMELEVLSGAIVGWEGSDISNLGDIIHMNLVHIGHDHQSRYFVLFANTLLILAYHSEQNSLSYEGKIPVSGITLTSLHDNDRFVNAFEIAGPMIDQILVSCSTKQSKENWLLHLNRILKTNRFPSFGYSPLQVGNLEQNGYMTMTSPVSHQPSKSPPYEVLVQYLGQLYCRQKFYLKGSSFEFKCGKFLPSVSEIGNSVTPNMIRHKRKRFLEIERMQKSNSSSSGRISDSTSLISSTGSTDSGGAPSNNQLKVNESNLEKMSLKWRKGLSDLKRSPISTHSVSPNHESLRKLKSLPSSSLHFSETESYSSARLDKDATISTSFSINRTQSCPAIKLNPSDSGSDNTDHEYSDSVQVQSKKRRLQRQNAIDMDDGDFEYGPDENGNIERVNYNPPLSIVVMNGTGIGPCSLINIQNRRIHSQPTPIQNHINFFEQVAVNISKGDSSDSEGLKHEGTAEPKPTELYRTSLYAHWLMKLKLETD